MPKRTGRAEPMPHRIIAHILKGGLGAGDLLALAAIGWAIDLLRTALGIYEQVLSTDPVLLLIAVTLHFGDLGLGLWMGLTGGGGLWNFRISRFDPVKAGNWAGNLVKYSLAVAFLAMVANGTAHLPLVGLVTAGFDEAALLAVIALNLASILKHLFGGRDGVRRFFARVRFLRDSSAGRAAEAIVELVDEEDLDDVDEMERDEETNEPQPPRPEQL